MPARNAVTLLLAGLIGGCAGSSDHDASSGTEPRPYVMQYAAVYYGGPENSSFDWLELRRDGSYQAMVDGALHEGRYDEQDVTGREPSLTFTGEAEIFAGTLHPDWVAGHRLSLSRGGIIEALTTTSVGGETMCEASGGTWRDDDPDSAGLYCSCAVGMKYIPSAGGCAQ